MNDSRLIDFNPIGSPIAPTPSTSLPGATPDAAGAATWPAAAFSGRTHRKGAAVRAGIVLGTGLLLAIGAAVALGASPAPSGSTGAAVNGTGANPGDPGLPGFAPGWPGGPDGEGGEGWAFGGRGHGKGHAFGRISVTGVSGSSLSLATDDGWTRTVTVNDATTITRAGAAATLADIAVGDVIRFSQSRNDDGTFTITAINIVLPQATGTVTAVTADTITITLRDGTSQTIRTTADTTYQIGRTAGTRTAVTVGSMIVAAGEQGSDGTLTATTVRVHLPHVFGTVTGKTADAITISRPDGTTVTIHVGTDTTIGVAGNDSASIADVAVGMVLAAEGTQRADGSIDATEVRAGDLGRGRGHGKGLLPGDLDAAPAPDAAGNSQG